MFLTFVRTGSPRRSATAYVTVHVADVNDNAPTFTHAHYRVRIKENNDVPTVVTSVHASDADADENAVIRCVVTSSAF